MSEYIYCEGCNTHYVDTGCGQIEEHAYCPYPCSMCGELMTGRENGCQGHTREEHDVFLERLRHNV